MISRDVAGVGGRRVILNLYSELSEAAALGILGTVQHNEVQFTAVQYSAVH